MERLLDWRRLDTIDLYSYDVNVESGPYYIGHNIQPKGVKMLPSYLIYPHSFKNKYNKDVPDNCVSFEWLDGISNKTVQYKGEDIYIQYPCQQFPKSYAIKHWNIGASWRKK